MLEQGNATTGRMRLSLNSTVIPFVGPLSVLHRILWSADAWLEQVEDEADAK